MRPWPLRRWPGTATPRSSTAGKGIGYHDLDDENRGGAAGRQYEGVDICDSDGALVMCYIRGGEWVRYTVEVLRSGTYRASVRLSSPYFPAGRLTMTFGDKTVFGPMEAAGTTSHSALEPQSIAETHFLRRGTHEFEVRMDEAEFQNFNIDCCQFDRAKH